MKFLIALASIVLFTGILIAENDAVKVVATSLTGTTNTTVTPHLSGKVDSIAIDTSTTSTGTVAITAGGETILGVSSITADAVYRPRIGVGSVAGVSYSDVTNNLLVPFLVVNEPLTITWAGNNATSQSVNITIKLTDK